MLDPYWILHFSLVRSLIIPICRWKPLRRINLILHNFYTFFFIIPSVNSEPSAAHFGVHGGEGANFIVEFTYHESWGFYIHRGIESTKRESLSWSWSLKLLRVLKKGKFTHLPRHAIPISRIISRLLLTILFSNDCVRRTQQLAVIFTAIGSDLSHIRQKSV